MLKRSISILCLLLAVLCLSSCGLGSQQAAASYYYLPSFEVVQSAEEEYFAVLSEPVDIDSAGLTIVNGKYDGRFLSVCFQLDDAAAERDWDDDVQLKDVILRVGDREEIGYYNEAMNCLWFSFTDPYGVPMPFTDETQILNAALVLGMDRMSYPIIMEKVEPVSALEKLGTVVREADIAMVFVPEAEGLLVQAFSEKSWGEGITADLKEVDQMTALNEQGDELYILSAKPAFTAHFPLSAIQQEEIASYAVGYIDLELVQSPKQVLMIPLDAIADREQRNQNPLSYELYGQFPVKLYDAYIPQGDVMGAGKWALSFSCQNDMQLKLLHWDIEGVSEYLSGSGGSVSYLGAYIAPEQIKEDVISLEMNALEMRQYGKWCFENPSFIK